MAQGFFGSRRRYSSYDTLRRLFCILDFESFQRVFIDWTQEVKKSLGIKKDQICVDGKTLGGSFNRSKSIQAPTEEKWDHGDSWTLDLLDLRGCLVSINAMSDGHCSKGDRKKGIISWRWKKIRKGLMKRLRNCLEEVGHEKKINRPKASIPKKKRMSTVEMNPDAVAFFI